jgi:hypothetical protein
VFEKSRRNDGLLATPSKFFGAQPYFLFVAIFFAVTTATSMLLAFAARNSRSERRSS